MKFKTIFLMGICTFMFVGCIRPYQKPIIEEIGTNETAFLITLEGNQKDQVQFNSIDYLNEAKVPAKRIEIQTRWLQTGRFSHQGEWIPMTRLVKVNRQPVARRWTIEENTGTSNQRQILEAESRDSIGVSSGFSLTAYITEADTAKYLYKYPNSRLSAIIDNQIFNDIQAVYSEVASKYNVTELRFRKDEINEAIRSVVIPLYAIDGITISPSLGLIGGLMYDNTDIQNAIDTVFIAQNLEARAEAERDAQVIENQRLKAIEENQAEIRKIRASAEAIAINTVSDAINQGGEAYLRLAMIEVLKDALIKWNGTLPETLSAGGSNPLTHLMLNQ